MASNKKMITLRSSDGVTYEVEEIAALKSQTIKHMIEDDCADNVIPLPNVKSKILSKVIEYCKKHVASVSTTSSSDHHNQVVDEELKKWNAGFVKVVVEQDNLFDLMLAADYLDIKNLLDLTCQTAANMIVGKTPEQIRKIFNIENDFTQEEEEAVRIENPWAFE